MPGHSDETQRTRAIIDVIEVHFRTMTRQEKDRLLQVRLAEARGPKRNAQLLLDMTAMLLRARRIKQGREQRGVDESDP